MTAALTSRQPTEDRKLEIIDAVLALAAQRSPGQIATADIAAALGLSSGAIFKHFPNKATIWLAVMAWVDQTLSGALGEAANRATHPLDGLHAMFAAHVDFAVRHPGVPRFIFHELQQATDSPIKQHVGAMLQRYRAMLRALLDKAHHDGALRPGLDRDAAATLFIGMIQGLVMQGMVAGSNARLREAGEEVFPIYLAGIAGELRS